MRWFRFAGLVLFVTVVQASILANLQTGPDLLLILLVFFCIYSDPTEAIIASFLIGFAADLIGSPMPLMPMGPQTISFGLFGTTLAYLHRVINVRNMPGQALAMSTSSSAWRPVVEMAAFMAPAVRMWRVSARVSTPSMPITPCCLR